MTGTLLRCPLATAATAGIQLCQTILPQPSDSAVRTCASIGDKQVISTKLVNRETVDPNAISQTANNMLNTSMQVQGGFSPGHIGAWTFSFCFGGGGVYICVCVCVCVCTCQDIPHAQGLLIHAVHACMTVTKPISRVPDKHKSAPNGHA
jgi:hypothetical protein